MRAVALLSMWKTRNSLRSILTDPRKLIPTLIAIAYLGFMLFVFSLPGAMRPPVSEQTRIPVGLYDTGLFLAFLLITVAVIDNGLGDNLLAFPPPDVDYVFPSPISRRVVLFFRLPSLTFGACFLAFMVLFMYRFVARATLPDIAHLGTVGSSKWFVVAAAVLCVGINMNLAMFIAIRFEKRRAIHRYLMGFLFALVAGLGLVAWLGGLPAMARVAGSPWLRWPFLPADLVARVMMLRLGHQSPMPPFLGLIGLYGLSLIPMFVTNVNFYEESIASSERVWTLRRAAKSGFASLMAVRASNSKFKSRRDYTFPPFGEGAVALFWAHMCAAWKRPYASFLAPFLGGIAVGIIGGAANKGPQGLGLGLIALLLMYSSFGFMASARTASEAAIRRREITATLPIPGWQSVAANLGVPFISVILLALGSSAAYACMGGFMWPLAVCSVTFFFTLRMFARMAIMYMLSLAYPDFADKIQQFLGQMIYYLFGAPLLIAEMVVCIPALFLRSFWVALVSLVLFEAGLSVLLLLLAGRVSERAVATGEPVRFWRMRK